MTTDDFYDDDEMTKAMTSNTTKPNSMLSMLQAQGMGPHQLRIFMNAGPDALHAQLKRLGITQMGKRKKVEMELLDMFEPGHREAIGIPASVALEDPPPQPAPPELAAKPKMTVGDRLKAQAAAVGRAAPEKTASEKAAAERAASEKAAVEKAAAEQAEDMKAAAEKAAAERMAAERAAAEQAVVERAAAAAAGAERAEAEKKKAAQMANIIEEGKGPAAARIRSTVTPTKNGSPGRMRTGGVSAGDSSGSTFGAARTPERIFTVRGDASGALLASPGGRDTTATPSCAPARLPVLIDAGGTRFKTSEATLRAHSELLAEMLEDPEHRPASAEDAIFVDIDPDAFACLLRYMRTGGAAATHLPANDPSLFASVVLGADMLGMAHLVEHVEATSLRNAHLAETGKAGAPASMTDDAAASAFLERFGSLAAAFEQGSLPALYFGTM